MKSTAEKLMSHVAVTESGCWQWTGCLAHNGYGQFGLEKRTRSAHTVAFETWIGPIPAGYQVDHTCHNGTDCAGGKTCLHRRCINPDHLDAVTQRTNISRSHNTGGKTHCLRGHELAGANLRVNGRGMRSCLQCKRDMAAERQAAADVYRFENHLLTLHETSCWLHMRRGDVGELLEYGILRGERAGYRGAWLVDLHSVIDYADLRADADAGFEPPFIEFGDIDDDMLAAAGFEPMAGAA